VNQVYPLRGVNSHYTHRHYQGKAQEALKLLADCLGWFTEGFDAPDLQTAQALVDELKQPADADVG
jgi:hypothetical protein